MLLNQCNYGLRDNLFLPLDLSVEAWYDAADPFGDGNRYIVNTNLNKWADKSGHGHHADSVVGTPVFTLNQFSNGTMPAISFTGSQYFTVPYSAGLNANSMTIIIVCCARSGTNTLRSPITSRISNPNRGWNFYASDTNNWSFWVGNGSGGTNWQKIAGGAVTLNQLVMLTGFANVSSNPLYINGAITTGSTTSYASNINPSNQMYLGGGENGSENFVGDICEILIYKRILQTWELQKNWFYLATKWGDGIS